MRHRQILATLAIALASAPAWASEGAASCDGWSMTSNYLAESVHITQVSLEVLQDGEWVSTGIVEEDSFWLDNPEIDGQRTWFTLGGPWTDPLPAGTYRATITNRRWIGEWGSESAALAAISWDSSGGGQQILPTVFEFTCTPSADPRTPGYWKNHAEVWEGVSLQLGDMQGSFDQDCLLALLSLRAKGDIRVKLVQHLIAAKLNVLAGSDPSIQPAIDEADALLLTSDINCLGIDGPRPRDDEKELFEAVKDTLDLYNNGVL